MIKLLLLRKLKLMDHNFIYIITHYIQFNFRLGNYHNKIWCFVTSLGKIDLILKIFWFEQYDLKLSFYKKTLSFNSKLYILLTYFFHNRFYTISNYSLKKNQTKPDSFISRFESLPEDILESCHYFNQYQTDRQTKNTNMMLKQYLRTYVNCFLLITKFKANLDQNYFSNNLLSNLEPLVLLEKY